MSELGVIFYRGPSLLTGERIVGILTGLEGGSLNPKTGPMVQAWILRDDRSPMQAVRDGSDTAICGDCALRGDGAVGRTCYVTPWLGPHNVWKTFESGGYLEATWPDLMALLEGLHVRLGAYGDPAAIPFEVWRLLLTTAAGWVAYCVAPETMVLTGDLRWVRAGDVRTGDVLMGFDEFPVGVNRHWRAATVTTAERVVRPCYSIRLRDGTTVIASADHPWLVRGSRGYVWKQTAHLRAGGRRPTNIAKLIDKWADPVHSWDAGYLAATFDGEGYIGNGGLGRRGHMGHLGFAQRDNAMAKTACAALDIYGFEHSKYSRHDGCSQHHVKGGVREVLRLLGQMRPARLLGKFKPDECGRLTARDHVAVESLKYIGEREVAAFGTTTGTFVAEGFASHNTHQWLICDPRLREIAMASVDTDREFDRALIRGWRTFRVRGKDDPVHAGIECVCPASEEGGHRTTCQRCQLCRGTNRQARSIVIIAHGKPGNVAAFYRNHAEALT